VVIQKTEQMGAAFLARLAWVRQPGTHHRVALPERIGMLAFEAFVIARGLRQQTTRFTLLTQVGCEGMDIQGLKLLAFQFRITLEQVHDHGGGSLGLLFAQGNRFLHHFQRESARSVPVRTHLRTQRIEAILLVEIQIASQGGDTDFCSAGIRAAVGLGSDFAQVSLQFTGSKRAKQQS